MIELSSDPYGIHAQYKKFMKNFKPANMVVSVKGSNGVERLTTIGEHVRTIFIADPEPISLSDFEVPT